MTSTIREFFIEHPENSTQENTWDQEEQLLKNGYAQMRDVLGTAGHAKD